MSVTPAFETASARACIRALRGLEQTAIMLEKWGPEAFPENEQGQKHFGRCMTDAAAEAIRDAWKVAIQEVEHFPDDKAGWIAERGELRSAILEAVTDLSQTILEYPDAPHGIVAGIRRAVETLRAGLKTKL
jgi:hypothetical protein